MTERTDDELQAFGSIVVVVDYVGETFVGRVVEPVPGHLPLHAGDVLSFGPEHIIEIDDPA